MDNHVHLNLVHDVDQILLFNGPSVTLDYYELEVGKLESSSWITYTPEKYRYRFLGFQIFMSPDLKTTDRMNYGMSQALLETGGMYKMLDLFFGLVYAWIKPERLFPYLAAALYRDDKDEDKVTN